jgi:hypothetical protein
MPRLELRFRSTARDIGVFGGTAEREQARGPRRGSPAGVEAHFPDSELIGVEIVSSAVWLETSLNVTVTR